MSTAAPAAHLHEYPTFGLPAGSVRGFLSVLICLFFWIVLLQSPNSDFKAPLAHFFLLTMVYLAFASHPLPEDRTHFLPWLMRVLFGGGSVAVVAVSLSRDPQLAATRLTPTQDELSQWPVLLACLTGGFAAALFLRFILGRRSEIFMTLRAWVGIIAMLLLLFEILLQFIILPGMNNKDPEAIKVWEGILIAIVAAYFGSRA